MLFSGSCMSSYTIFFCKGTILKGYTNEATENSGSYELYI